MLNSARASGSMSDPETTASLHGVTACMVEVCIPPSRTALSL
ncbi:MAG TPA: hypothetical protein VIJ09_06960 [Acidimicrobiales bacterium]